MKLVLGSASPRRSDLLHQLGFDFRVLKADCSEDFDPKESPESIVIHIAQQKADALLPEIDLDELLICADTIVYLHGEVIGKPCDEKDAIGLLSRLSGQMHEVYTGVIIQSSNQHVSFTVKTSVYFRSLTRDEMTYYVSRFNPLDKAGSYGIQDWIGLIGVEKIEGSYTNVMGLPTHELYQALRKMNA